MIVGPPVAGRIGYPAWMRDSTTLPSTILTGVLAGVAGTAAMTAFQRLVEMPLTGREESYEPAALVEKLLPIRPKSPRARRRLNYAAHFGVGLGWGAAHAALSRRWDLHGPRGGATVFATLWPADVLGLAVAGLHAPPWKWSGVDMAVDFTDKMVLAQATGLAFDRLQARARGL